MNFHRYYIPGAIVFITQVVENRVPVFQNANYLALLRVTLHNVKALHPFSMLAYAFLPDHCHLLLRPTGASNFSQIMHSLKPNFAKAYKQAAHITGNLSFWQKRFWDHVIRDELDLQRHLDYIHYNPVKHGLTMRPEDWPDTSFALWKKRGAYPEKWGWSLPETIANYDIPD